MMMHLLGSISWNPGFKGILVVAVGVAILYGSVALIVSTNSGARLGFLLALTGLFGWYTVMGTIWSIYGIGYKGPAPTWHVVDVVVGNPSGSEIEKARSLPLPDAMNEKFDPVALRDASKELLKEFPPHQKNPTRSDLASVDQEIADKINEAVAPWKILATSNKYTGETQSAVAEALGPNGEKLFLTAADYMVLDSYVVGGKQGRTDDSTVGRVVYKVTSVFNVKHDPFYAAVQIQPVIPQTTKPGQAPPPPVRDPDAPVYTVILQRDHGALRLPSISFTAFSGIVFAVLANSLHRRDKLAEEQRAAVAGAA